MTALVEGLGALGPEWDGVLAGGPGVQSGRDWMAATAEAAVPAGGRVLLALGHQAGGAPAWCVPLLARGREAASLTSPYSVLWQPLVATAAGAEDAARALGWALGRALRPFPLVRLEAMDPGWVGFEGFGRGLRRAGRVVLRFDGFGNWHERVEGLGWDGYLARRPGALREVLRRRGRAAARAGLRFAVIDGPAGLEEGLAAYEAVYRRSWKEPEPFPGFTAALLRRLAPRGEMRLGLAWHGDTPVAAQYWTVFRGVATVLKLAHDEEARAFSPGTLLTGHMVRVLLEGGVAELDFGRGDDPYKRQWAAERRQRIGLVLADPARIAGLAAIGRHLAGRAMRAGRAWRARP